MHIVILFINTFQILQQIFPHQSGSLIISSSTFTASFSARAFGKKLYFSRCPSISLSWLMLKLFRWPDGSAVMAQVPIAIRIFVFSLIFLISAISFSLVTTPSTRAISRFSASAWSLMRQKIHQLHFLKPGNQFLVEYFREIYAAPLVASERKYPDPFFSFYLAF